MTDRSGAGSLTGIWDGLYTYPDGRSTSFVAILIESGGALSGTTHEPGTRPDGAGTLCASLAGSRSSGAVRFIKTYDRPTPYHQCPVHYEGALNGDATEIEGRWTIVRVWSGKFLMIRAAGRTKEVARTAFART